MVATTLAIVAVVALFVLAAEVLLLVFAGLLFAVLLSSLADALARISGMNRGMALGLTVLVLLAGTVGTAWALWPSMSEQADQLATQLPAALGELRGWFEQREWGRWLLGRAQPDQLADGGAIVDQATGVLLTTISALAAFLIILFVGLYVAAQPSLYQRGLRRLVPVAGRSRADEVLFEVISVLRWWLIGKVLSMVLVGVLTTVGLWWLDVPLALTFGLLHVPDCAGRTRRRHWRGCGDASDGCGHDDGPHVVRRRPAGTGRALMTSGNTAHHDRELDLICLPSSVMSQPRPRFRSSISYTDSLPIALDTRVEVTAATINGSAMG